MINLFQKIGTFIRNVNDGQNDMKQYLQIYLRESKNPINNLKLYDMMIIDISNIKTNERLQVEMEMRQTLFNKIAHEFKSPLMCLNIMLENMKRELEEGLIHNTIKTADEVDKLAHYIYYLIDDIIHYSSNSISNEIPIKFEIVNIIDDLEFSFGLLEVLLKVKSKNKGSIKTELSIDPEIKHYLVNIDNIRLRQVIINLLSNSVKFTKFGYIKIIASLIKNQETQENSYIEIMIEDTGIGMNTETLDKIFKGKRVIDVKLNSTLNKMGTGTGLNVVKSICDLMNIGISCESKKDLGTTMKITIKIIEFLLNSDQSNVTKSIKSSIKNHLYTTDFVNSFKSNYFNDDTKKNLIIVCDDSEIIRSSTVNLLKSIKCISDEYDILTSFDGIDLILKLIEYQGRGSKIKVALIDESKAALMIREFQNNKKMKPCNLVSISAIDNDLSNQVLVKAGFDKILRKPLNKTGIIECFKSLNLL